MFASLSWANRFSNRANDMVSLILAMKNIENLT